MSFLENDDAEQLAWFRAELRKLVPDDAMNDGDRFRRLAEMKARTWISVEERLPEVGQLVFMARAGDPYATFGMFMHAFTQLWPIAGTNLSDRTTHWMPALPEPPKEEAHGE